MLNAYAHAPSVVASFERHGDQSVGLCFDLIVLHRLRGGGGHRASFCRRRAHGHGHRRDIHRACAPFIKIQMRPGVFSVVGDRLRLWSLPRQRRRHSGEHDSSVQSRFDEMRPGGTAASFFPRLGARRGHRRNRQNADHHGRLCRRACSTGVPHGGLFEAVLIEAALEADAGRSRD